MTPETRAKLEQKLAEHGLTVLLTRDYDSILIQLARLALFERLVITNDHLFAAADVEALRHASRDIETADDTRLLTTLDIPTIGIEVHRALHNKLDSRVCIDPVRLNAAVAAFVGILCAEVNHGSNACR